MSGADSDTDSDPQSPPDPRDFSGGSDSDVNEKILQKLSHLEDNQQQAQEERRDLRGRVDRGVNSIRHHVNREDNHQSSLEDIYLAVIIATIGIGVIGLLSSILVSGFGFVPLFVIGLSFLVYAYSQGLPTEI
ncbi:hypothetical protein NP511_13455 [Natrinema thermotolerans]|uniref:Uncharacterized protein n=1 Tax=Natrinema thermotolerans TaxID=121872 RepID=A0AAF0SXR9_9EURY|nr:hypothetical protein [Natrinema thermotolerans]WMT06391.1 hypothetical protein NP511_13455 [Natrinema thermotolerans]